MVTALRDAMPWTLLPTFRSIVLLPPSTLIEAAVGSSDMLLNIYQATLRLVTGLSPRRPGFNPGPIHFGFVINKLASVQVFLQVLQLSPLTINPQMLHIHITLICHGRHTNLATDSLVKQNTSSYMPSYPRRRVIFIVTAFRNSSLKRDRNSHIVSYYKVNT